MNSNFIHTILEIAVGVVIVLLFMVALLYYRKYAGKFMIQIPEMVKQYLLQQSFYKVSFIFAFFCFAIWVSYRHSGHGCEDLDEAAQCECYALQVANKSDIKQQLHWARNGMRMCPDSKFFSNFIEKVQNEAK